VRGEGLGGGGYPAKKTWVLNLVAVPDPVRSFQESPIPSSAAARSFPAKSAHTQSTSLSSVSKPFGSSAHLSTDCSPRVCANAPFHQPAHHVRRSPLSEKGSYEASMRSRQTEWHPKDQDQAPTPVEEESKGQVEVEDCAKEGKS